MEQWLSEQPMKGQQELPLLFCDEVNSEFTSEALPGADWGTWSELKTYADDRDAYLDGAYAGENAHMEPPC